MLTHKIVRNINASQISDATATPPRKRPANSPDDEPGNKLTADGNNALVTADDNEETCDLLVDAYGSEYVVLITGNGVVLRNVELSIFMSMSWLLPSPKRSKAPFTTKAGSLSDAN